MKNLNYLKEFITEFNEFYFKKRVKEYDRLNVAIEKIKLNTKVNSLFDFSPDESDEFIVAFFNRFSIESGDYIHGLHFDDLMKSKMFFTSILLPFIGYKNWMLFSKENRTPLTINHLCDAINNKKINSLKIAKSII